MTLKRKHNLVVNILTKSSQKEIAKMKKILGFLVIVSLLCIAVLAFGGSTILTSPNSGSQQVVDQDGNVTAVSSSNQVTLTSPSKISNYLNAGFTPTPAFVGMDIRSCGTTATCAATSVTTSMKVIYGQVALATGSAVIVGVSPAFTSVTSFGCLATDNSASNAAVKVANTATNSITLTGNGTDTVSYFCFGQ